MAVQDRQTVGFCQQFTADCGGFRCLREATGATGRTFDLHEPDRGYMPRQPILTLGEGLGVRVDPLDRLQVLTGRNQCVVIRKKISARMERGVETSRSKLCFTIPRGNFLWERLPVAPSPFQRR